MSKECYTGMKNLLNYAVKNKNKKYVQNYEEALYWRNSQ